MTRFARTLLTFALVAAPAAADAFERKGGAPIDPAMIDRWAPLQDIAGKVFGFTPTKSADSTASLRFDRVVVGLDDQDGGIDARFGASSPATLEAPRARIGYAFDRFVAFGTAGMAFAAAEFVRAGEPSAMKRVGWAFGGGVEAPLFAGVRAKVEYLYVDIDRRAFDADGDVSVLPAGGQFRAGLNYRF